MSKMKLINREEMLCASLTNKYSFYELKETIKEAANLQLISCQKVETELLAELAKLKKIAGVE